MTRIDKKFKELRKRKKKAFIAFITAGYPSLEVTARLVLEMERAGVDIIELGVPFSDPMADGPIIQEASAFALKKGVNLAKILESVRKLRKLTRLPICLMTYYNPIFSFGQERFLKACASCGVDGVIIPDLPPEEGREFIKLADKYSVNNICFIAPTTSPERIKYIAKLARGFIYYVSLTGVTGPRQALSKGLAGHIRLIKKATNKPVCVGFGVSSASQVRFIRGFADGVIVGSAIVSSIRDNLSKPYLERKVAGFIAGLIK